MPFPVLRRAAGCLCLCWLFAHQAGFCQIRIPLTVTDAEGHAAAVEFGYDALATRCIDTLLGEFELPPGGCGDPTICASFRDLRDDSSACLGNGLLLDLRPFGAASDTFRLVIAGATAPVVLRWQLDPTAHFDSLRLVDRSGGTVDMLARDSAVCDLALSPERLLIGWGALHVTAAAPAGPEVPATTALLANYPNPFNPSTTVTYRLARRAAVQVSVFTILGVEVARLVDDVEEPGVHAVVWDAGEAPSGWYACRLIAGGTSAVRRMLLVR